MTTQGDDNRARMLEQAIRLKRAAAAPPAPKISPRPTDGTSRIGEYQHSLWLAHQMEPQSPAYNLASAFRVSGPLDIARLQDAFNQVVSRHRLLHSTFRLERGFVRQVEQPLPKLTVEVIEARDGEALAAAISEARKPFDLEIGPLTRMILIRESGGVESILLLMLHHILADERSLAALWRELSEAYGGGSFQGPARVQYDDYVHWLEGRDPRHREAELDFWRQRLDPPPEDLNLPFERPTPDPAELRGRLLTRSLSRSPQEGVRRLASITGASPFTVYAFAFHLLLQRYADGQPVAFATPVSTRSHPDTAEMLGYFLNPVVVSGTFDESDSVETAIRSYSRTMRDLLGHATLPFSALAEELAPPRRHDRHPIFQAMFVYQEAGEPPCLGEARLEPVTLDLGASKFDLTLFVEEGDDAFTIAVEYRTDRSHEDWMQRLLVHYETLIERLPVEPAQALAEVSMLSEGELSRIRSWSRGVAARAEHRALLPERILDQATRSPHSPALVCGGVHKSYEQFRGAAENTARALRAHHVRPGDRVAVFIDRSAAMVEAIIACHWAGAAYVPLDPTYPEARNKQVLEDASVTAVATTSSLRQTVPSGAWAVVENDGPLQHGDDGPISAQLSPASPAYLLYTSGSTGRPKGVVVTHGNLSASTEARFQAYDAPPKRFLLIPSVAFDSSVAGIFWTLSAGGTLVVPTDDEVRDPRRLARLVFEQRVDSLLCVPSVYAQLLAAGGELLVSLENVIVAGESCPARLVREHFQTLSKTRLFNEYGPTEATVWSTLHEMTESDASRLVPIGRPIPGVRIDIVDGLGRPAPTGIPGRAWISGPTVADGYWRQADLSAERFVTENGSDGPERRYRTGDVMAWTVDGRLLFLGREDQQIKLRGFRIEPEEIESAIVECLQVDQAAVVARSIGSGKDSAFSGETSTLVAFIPAAGNPVAEDWRQRLATRLPDHMIPARLEELAKLPLLPNGKIDRSRLRRMALHRAAVTPSHRPIPSAREQTLISLWEGLLGVSGITAEDNFFELGGHSLQVVEMALAIERDFEVSLTVAEIFEIPTVGQLAARIEQQSGGGAVPYEHLFPIQPSGRGKPFVVAVPHFFSGMFAERFRGERPVYGLRGVSLRPEGNLGRWRSMTELAEQLVEEIDRRFPDQSCILAGYSFGASMAFEAARLMEERGTPVHGLYMMAPMPLDFYRFGPFRVQIDDLRQPTGDLAPTEAFLRYARANNPLTRRPYRRIWRWFGIEPWRRLLCAFGKIRVRAGLPLTARILYADVRVDRFRLHAAWRPGRIETPSVIFNATDTGTDAAATWRPHFTGPFEVVPTPDPHLDGDAVAAARRVILDHLSELEDA
jgi:amino acid adenylation domain-containing protein